MHSFLWGKTKKKRIIFRSGPHFRCKQIQKNKENAWFDKPKEKIRELKKPCFS
jgi:hypothetical protein